MLTVLKWLKDVAVFVLHLLDKLLLFAICLVLALFATENIGLSVLLALLLTYTYSISNRMRKIEQMLSQKAPIRKEPV